MPEINAELNLVLPLRYREVQKPDPQNPGEMVTVSEACLWAYHSSIKREVFRANYRVIASAKDALFRKGNQYAVETGLPIADLTLLDAASADAAEWRTADVGPALLAEFRRLTTILVPGDRGFEYVLMDTARQRGLITEDEAHDLECVIVFFTCASAITMSANKAVMTDALASVLRGSITSLTPTEWSASLGILTPVAVSMPTLPSLVPS